MGGCRQRAVDLWDYAMVIDLAEQSSPVEPMGENCVDAFAGWLTAGRIGTAGEEQVELGVASRPGRVLRLGSKQFYLCNSGHAGENDSLWV